MSNPRPAPSLSRSLCHLAMHLAAVAATPACRVYSPDGEHRGDFVDAEDVWAVAEQIMGLTVEAKYADADRGVLMAELERTAQQLADETEKAEDLERALEGMTDLANDLNARLARVCQASDAARDGLTLTIDDDELEEDLDLDDDEDADEDDVELVGEADPRLCGQVIMPIRFTDPVSLFSLGGRLVPFESFSITIRPPVHRPA